MGNKIKSNNQTNRSDLILIILAIIATCGFAWTFGAHIYLKQQYQHNQSLLSKSKVKLAKSKESAINSITEYDPESVSINKHVTNFFKNFYTYKDQTSYQNRKNKVKNDVAADIYNSKKWFDEGKDVTGGDYVSISGLSSQYVGSAIYIDNQVANSIRTGRVIVQFKANRRDQEGTTNSMLYTFKYDNKTHRIMQLKKIGKVQPYQSSQDGIYKAVG